MECYGIGEMPSPNHKGRRTSGGSHGDDTDSDGASLTGPQPYSKGRNESSPGVPPVPSECGLEPRRLRPKPTSHGGIPRPSGRGGGQSLREQLDRRQERIETLEEQLAKRSNIYQKVEDLPDKLRAVESEPSAPFFIEWYLWWRNR
jgi:hypothetical protein